MTSIGWNFFKVFISKHNVQYPSTHISSPWKTILMITSISHIHYILKQGKNTSWTIFLVHPSKPTPIFSYSFFCLSNFKNLKNQLKLSKSYFWWLCEFIKDFFFWVYWVEIFKFNIHGVLCIYNIVHKYIMLLGCQFYTTKIKYWLWTWMV